MKRWQLGLCLSGYPVKLVWAIKHVFLNNVETANPKKFTLTKFSEQNEEEQKRMIENEGNWGILYANNVILG